MTIDDINKRIQAIEQLQNNFDKRVEVAESNLLIKVLSSWDSLRSRMMPTFKKVWNLFLEADYIPLVESFVEDMHVVVDLNRIYFEGEQVPTTGLFDRLGITAESTIIKDGYVSTILQDQTAKRELQQFINRTRPLKFDQKVKSDITKLIQGEKPVSAKNAQTEIQIVEKPGIIKKFTNQNVTDSYNEADRIVQQEYAEKSGMSARMYTGGLIDGSRPFCVIRNRHVFLDEEIALFGTSEDKWGGYTDKSAGLFSGKPKTGYDPFIDCGGHKCRHHWSVLANEYATRIDKTIIEENGKLKRI